VAFNTTLTHYQTFTSDLKPSNVGFDFNGEIKLFDFGLAREILDDGRKMTAYTGSARYMAPEGRVCCYQKALEVSRKVLTFVIPFLAVARGDYYGFPADVYSFSILLWEVCTLEKAYKGMSKKEHLEFVVGSNMRPNLHIFDDDPSLRNFIEMCWCQEPKSRPTFREIKTRIPAEFLLHACLLDSSRSNRYVRLKSRTGAVPSQSSDLKRIIDSFNGSIKF
jgi:serine/threonine protein kinase